MQSVTEVTEVLLSNVSRVRDQFGAIGTVPGKATIVQRLGALPFCADILLTLLRPTSQPQNLQVFGTSTKTA
jgi:hypothetical protein